MFLSQKTIHCGEYGEQFGRPHYHAILFNQNFSDRETLQGHKGLTISEQLSKLWGKGHTSIGDVTFQSASYVAGYVQKKINGKQKEEHYQGIDPTTGGYYGQRQQEYSTMSRRPGIAGHWFAKHKNDVYPSDNVHIGGREMRPDYFGIPTKQANLEFSALWHRAYTLVWNDWFRDENLQAPKTVLTTSGADATAYELLNRGKKHDYFTSALPWPQKGADVTIPLGSTAPVAYTPDSTPDVNVKNITSGDQHLLVVNSGVYLETGGVDAQTNSQPLYADLSDATSATINQLRLAFATQKFLEIQARGGSRYIEVIKNHFNVTSPDTGQHYPPLVNKQSKTKRSMHKAQLTTNSHLAIKNATQNTDTNQALLLENSALTQRELSSLGITRKNTDLYRYSEIHGYR